MGQYSVLLRVLVSTYLIRI